MEEVSAVSTPNRLVLRLHRNRNRKHAGVAQVSEYWPLSKLAFLNHRRHVRPPRRPRVRKAPHNARHPTYTPTQPLKQQTRVDILHPSLLAQATNTACTPLNELALRQPRLRPHSQVHRDPNSEKKKFPGNAEGAQMEMMEAAIEAANRGLRLLPSSSYAFLHYYTSLLNQGNPVVGGRVGRRTPHPGVSSVLAAPTFANISKEIDHTPSWPLRGSPRSSMCLWLPMGARGERAVRTLATQDGGHYRARIDGGHADAETYRASWRNVG